MKDNKGFIAISLIYSFFLVFLMTLLAIVADYAHNRILLNDLKRVTQENLNKRSEFNPVFLPEGEYKVGDSISYVNESWKVLAVENDLVTLVLSRALSNDELTKALSCETNSLVKEKLTTAIDIEGEKVLMCYNKVSSNNICFYESDEVGRYDFYTWQTSIAKLVVDHWYNNNALLQRAQAQGGLVLMTFNDSINYDNFRSYIRIPLNTELSDEERSLWWSLNGSGSSFLISDSKIIAYDKQLEIRPVIQVKIKG